ncbi:MULTISPECIES: hypothetical protein [unclassified Ruegeria]|uniref:hypothetical protein n=1 Tax=unclassified Ruegeria TaxID=2625375 RepID=UPI001ADB9E86|nr:MULTISPECIES: hypothetical protein [unclassified Ruegeria]MBO9412804.1 hypothetical protein [Ruegeria sp. R8_1]MBO9416648.1 hypothetical protein [Ruegeria sp. R8_2]
MNSEYPTLRQFFDFVVLATLMAVLAFLGWSLVTIDQSAANIANRGTSFGLLLTMTVFLGWPIWGSILLFGLFPGRFVFVFVCDTLRHLPFGRNGSTLIAAAAVAVSSWFLSALIFSTSSSKAGLFESLFLLQFGVPAAMIAAWIALPKPE